MVLSYDYNALTFTVLQWNILCLQFCDQYSFPKVDKKYLEWDYRKKRFLELFNRKFSDLICLEEVDEFELFQGIIKSINPSYQYLYERKNKGSQGIALFYNPAKFKLINYKRVDFANTNQFFLIAFLKNIPTNKNIALIITHLKSKKENEVVRIKEMKQMLIYLTSTSFFQDYKSKYNCKGIVITGDFNTDPDSTSINLLKKLYFLNKYQIFNAFKNVDFTTFKIRDKTYLRTIDYLFFSHYLEVVSSSSLPGLNELMPYGLPNKRIPSDHLYLRARFRFF